MRFLTPAALALALTLALHVPARAQLPKVRIDDNGELLVRGPIVMMNSFTTSDH